MKTNLPASNYNFRLLGVLLILGLVHGLIYVFLVPPWQHYDEPNHFEYVWLAAHQPSLPKPGDRDQALNRMVVRSMLANGFFKGMDYRPDLNSSKLSIYGYPQLDQPPLYYLAASLSLRFMGGAAVETQLHAARLVSLVLFLLTVLAAWGIVSEMTSPGNPLRWLLPLFLVFLPSFVDLMTAVNNDVIAIAAFSWFLWASVRLIRRGFNILDFIWMVLAVIACFFSKTSVFISLPLAFIVLLFAVLRGRWRPLAWGGVALIAFVSIVGSLSWGDAALWYRSTSQVGPTRVATGKAVLGGQAIALDARASVTPPWLVPLFQPVPRSQVQALTDKTVTLGAWIWASRPVKARTPQLSDGLQTVFQTVELSQAPVFHAITMTLTAGSDRLWVSLNPKTPSDAAPIRIYYDGVVLAQGSRPLQTPPSFSDIQGRSGEWGGQPFVNLVRNGSAEQAGVRVRSQIDDLGARFLPDDTRPSLILTSILDWPGSGRLYWMSLGRLFPTFWATFGTGNVFVKGYHPYWVLAFFTLLGLAGAVLAFFRHRKRIPWDLAFLFALVLLVVWGGALVRSPIYLAVSHIYLPVARYTYPAIIPTAFVLCSGWLELFWLAGWPFQSLRGRIFSKDISVITFSFLFILLDILSILSIQHYYLH